MSKTVLKTLIGTAALVCAPALAFAQASVTGTVRDTSGAVLPGVSVDASSSALIEKVRSAVTDGTGRYRITDLPPGTYRLAFALSGFATVQRDEIELSGSFTATVNVDMRVGGLEETITIRGEAPIVDVQSTVRQDVLKGSLITDLAAAARPTGPSHVDAIGVDARIGRSTAVDIRGPTLHRPADVARVGVRVSDPIAPLRAWLTDLHTAVRNQDFAAGKKLCAEDMVAFGTVAPFVTGIDNIMQAQWAMVWPYIRGFTIDVANARVFRKGNPGRGLTFAEAARRFPRRARTASESRDSLSSRTRQFPDDLP